MSSPAARPEAPALAVTEASAARPPVTADDLDHAVQLAVAALRQVPAAVWDGAAGTLEWTCWETAEHLADDLFAYAVQLGPRTPPLDREVSFHYESRRPGGPANSVHANRDAGPDGLLEVLEASGALLAAMVRTASPDVRSHHCFGVSDPEGFAAMGVVETLVHTHDIAQGPGLPWEPPAGLCSRVLARLFRDVPEGAAPWQALLWSTGRADLPGRPRPGAWRWYGAPLA
ncbi:maleylpyruvate isomerase N-terminal domain-containing protein [Streptomyces sp. NPDC006274]|uniref:maleylpyruvate isomerase N-terminal domain-containing protein n=1 Tax=unclassified Streptomyces TaxID=2593676 RepID=UPI0033A6B8E3